MSRLNRLGGAALVAVACLSLAAPAATAAQGVEYAPTMLVLDASGSMTSAKMDAAKRAVHTVIDAAPAEAEVGLTVYGMSTGSSDGEKAAGCQDVKVLRQAEVVDKPALHTVVDAITPRGYTPIGKALQTAADALPKEGPRSIVLVSDGIDTCAPPDPCEVVKTLAGQGVDLVVHAVGFGVDEQARNQLRCVAQVTGGTYSDAPDAKSLEQTLPRVTASALRNYEPSGIPVSGNSEVFSAPVLGPGQYLDAIGPKTEQFYAVDATEGSTIYFGATVVYPRIAAAGWQSVRVTIYGKDGGRCWSGDSQISSNTEDAEVLTAQATWDTTAKKNNKDCSGPGRYRFSVERAIADGHSSRLPLELLVGLEPPVNQENLPAPASAKVGYTDPGGPDKPAVGGGTFGTAATLDGAGHYADSLSFGEFVFYRVKVEWGQALNVQVRYENLGTDAHVFAPNEVKVYSPYRKEIASSSGFYHGNADTLGDGDRSVPVQYRNREADNREIAARSIAGYYYIAVKLGQNEYGAIGQPAPVYLDVSVTGEPQLGPEYRFASGKEQEGGIFGENKQGSAPEATQAPVVATVRESSFPTGWVLGGGGAAVLALGAVVLIMVLRRRNPAR